MKEILSAKSIDNIYKEIIEENNLAKICAEDRKLDWGRNFPIHKFQNLLFSLFIFDNCRLPVVGFPGIYIARKDVPFFCGQIPMNINCQSMLINDGTIFRMPVSAKNEISDRINNGFPMVNFSWL